jgi:hypothetical protein
MYKPPASLGTHCTDTALRVQLACEDPAMLRGVVHDPTAQRMGGVAGHAGCSARQPT